MDFTFENTQYFLCLLIIPFLIWRCIYLIRWRKKKIDTFADKNLQGGIFQGRSFLFLLNNILLIFIFIFLIIALANVYKGMEQKEIKREGADLVFALDLSNSMNAQDILPSRLENAKRIIYNILDNLGGDRVALVIFANDSYAPIPLTNDYGMLKLYLENIDTYYMNKQGTNVERAIKEAVKIFPEDSDISKVVLLFSDGEAHEGNIKAAIKSANNKDITVFSLGIGTYKGGPIAEESGEYKTDYSGNIIVSRLEDSSLKKLAQESGGKYILEANPLKASKIVINFLNNIEKKTQSSFYMYEMKQYFPYFIGFALILLIITTLTNQKNDFNI